jgi:TolA-binding protein
MRSARRLLLLVAAAAGAVLGGAAPAAAVPEPDRLWLVGERAFQDGLYGLARSVLERLLERHPAAPRVPEATLLLGQTLLAEGAAERALELFRRAQAFTPPPGRPEEPRFWEAEALFRLKRFEDARAAYARVAADGAGSPLAPEALYGLGWASLELKRREAAVTAFRQLVERHPDHAKVPSASAQLGRLLVDLKRYPEAIALLRSFPERYPEHALIPDVRYLLAVARVQGGEADQGLEDLRAFVAAFPRHELAARARRLVVDTLVREGKKADLLAEYKAAMAERPRTAERLYDAGFIATRLARAREAEQAWAALRADFPDHPLAARASLELAQAAFGRGAFKDAATLGRGAARSEEEAVRASALLLVGESELKLKRYAAAHEAFEAAAAAPGQDATLRFRALAGSGLAMEEQRQWARALRYYDEVARDSPDRELRAWARARRADVAGRLKTAPGSGPKPSAAPAPRGKR